MSKSKNSKTRIVAKDYGELFTQIYNQELIIYEEEADYQGEYILISQDDTHVYTYVDYFGSCSGCDWLHEQWISNEFTANYNECTVDYKEALDFCNQTKHKIKMPIKMFWRQNISEFAYNLHKEFSLPWDVLEEVVGALFKKRQLLTGVNK